MTLVSGFVYFGRVSLEFLWRAGSYFFCVGLRFVECRVGAIYLSVGMEWVAGLYEFSFLGFC